MSNQSTFNVTPDAETVLIPLAKARAPSPAEVAAMEATGELVSDAFLLDDKHKKAEATMELQECMRCLLHALAEETPRLRGYQGSVPDQLITESSFPS